MDSAYVAKIEKKLQEAPDCGDNSCCYAPKTGGMRTNGGCRCSEERSVLKRSFIERWAMGIAALLRITYEENAKLRAAIHQMIDESNQILDFKYKDQEIAIENIHNIGKEALK